MPTHIIKIEQEVTVDISHECNLIDFSHTPNGEFLGREYWELKKLEDLLDEGQGLISAIRRYQAYCRGTMGAMLPINLVLAMLIQKRPILAIDLFPGLI